MSVRVVYQIPKSYHTEIIGKGGSVIKKLQIDHSVKISVPAFDEDSTAVAITGSEPNVKATKAAIEKIVNCAIGTEILAKVSLDIPESDYGHLIGKGGATIRQLESTHNVSVEVPRGKKGNVHIEGSAKNVQACQAEIAKILKYNPKVASGSGSESKSAVPEFRADLSQPIFETLFFPEENHESAWNFHRFLGYLSLAQKTLDICVFTISDDRISRTVERQLNKGVKIRIITDNDTSANQGSDIDDFRKMGIEVKMDKTEFFMHHKFAIVDNCLLLNGSYNWTRTAATKNQENIMITNQKDFVSDFSKHFEYMWNNKDAFE